MAFAEGAPLLVQRGPQGGSHVEITARATGLGEALDLDLGLWWGETRIAQGVWFVLLSMESECVGRYPAMLAMIDPSTLPATDTGGDPFAVLDGAPLRLRLAATNELGASALFEVSGPGAYQPLADTGAF